MTAPTQTLGSATRISMKTMTRYNKTDKRLIFLLLLTISSPLFGQDLKTPSPVSIISTAVTTTPQSKAKHQQPVNPTVVRSSYQSLKSLGDFFPAELLPAMQAELNLTDEQMKLIEHLKAS
jgi:hypothetical protein